MTINFYLDSKLLSDGTKRIYCFVRGIEPQKSTMINTKIKIEPENWNSNKQEVKRSAKLFSQMNIHLNQIKEKIERLYLEELSAHSNLTKKEFDIILKENLFNDEKKSSIDSNANKFLLYYFKQFIESESTSLVYNSIVKYDALYNHLLGYQSISNRQITFDMIDMDFFDKFKKYLIKNKNLNNNSANNIFRLLKTYLNWCNTRGYYKDTTYKNFAVKTYAS